MTLLGTGATWLLSQTQAAAGIAMTYVRGSDRTSITAVRKARVERVNDENGIPVVVRRHAIKVAVGDIAYEPRAGDRIEETLGGDSIAWEVLPPADGEPCFRWWDHAQTAYVIDVTQVGV